MQINFYSKFRRAGFTCLLALIPAFVFSQATYFYQDFRKTTSLVNPQPDSSQFSHIILTAPQLSYYKFHKGYMELTRTRQDSATGGIIRVLRTTPFNPTPGALFIQITLSAESIQFNASNAIYFYLGEQFDPVNNSFPGNDRMFGRCVINFTDNHIVIKDPETQTLSEPIGLKKTFTLTWILNNSTESIEYNFVSGAQTLKPATYDLWIDDKPVHLGSKAYPGASVYSASKLSNFEVRFRNGLGKIRFYKMEIRGLETRKNHTEMLVAPNPVRGGAFSVNAKNILPESLQLYSVKGEKVKFEKTPDGRDVICIKLTKNAPSGIYLLHFRDKDNKGYTERVLLE